MSVEIGAEAALFPEKEYIYGIAVAVWELPWRAPISPHLQLLQISRGCGGSTGQPKDRDQ
jgi:hypothetical protein